MQRDDGCDDPRKKMAVRWAYHQMSYEVYNDCGEIIYMVRTPSETVIEEAWQKIADKIDEMCNLLLEDSNISLSLLLLST